MHRQGRRHFNRTAAAAIVAAFVATSAGAQSPAKAAGPSSQPRGPALPSAGTYKIDLAHTHAHFTISHLGISRFVGRFDDIQGEYVVGDRPEKSSVKGRSASTA